MGRPGGRRSGDPVAELSKIVVRARNHLRGDDLTDLPGGFGASFDAGAEAAKRVGELICSHIIARPHADLLRTVGL